MSIIISVVSLSAVSFFKMPYNVLPLVCIFNKYTNLTEKETGELKRFVGVGPLSCISPVSLFRLVGANWNDRL